MYRGRLGGRIFAIQDRGAQLCRFHAGVQYRERRPRPSVMRRARPLARHSSTNDRAPFAVMRSASPRVSSSRRKRGSCPVGGIPPLRQCSWLIAWLVRSIAASALAIENQQGGTTTPKMRLTKDVESDGWLQKNQ